MDASAGVRNANAATLKGAGSPATSVDLRMWRKGSRRVLFIINSPRTLLYDGKPIDVEVTLDAPGEVADALTGSPVPSRPKAGKRVIPLRLLAGEVRVFVAGR